MRLTWSYCQAAGFVAKRKTNQLEKFKKEVSAGTQRNLYKNKEERYSRVPRLSDTRYSAK